MADSNAPTLTAAPALPGGRWSLHPLAEFHWRCWGEDWVLFDKGSGQTLQLDALLVAALTELEQSPATLAELQQRLPLLLERALPAEVWPGLSQGLGFLVEQGLLRHSAHEN
ncbi:HPr-rel-A system PqqD family peptide chaperone [Mitsuaria sp. WAJ17]|uniref:HPr-rel-A system PqqD family peptide chaperone n=1 Tax=Mitsuaria sp. WAJ17 TaxID=2761452 RepID=UPI0015FF8730|nr:HPr-rel-A system PqqD family peptide chaperone [Mitsuaria sp. WAJ17]MBB2487303.1 HPr-rel-A system PqqD family peptide chaperone [Mitsuaria sp. WAJ17]